MAINNHLYQVKISVSNKTFIHNWLVKKLQYMIVVKKIKIFNLVMFRQDIKYYTVEFEHIKYLIS